MRRKKALLVQMTQGVVGRPEARRPAGGLRRLWAIGLAVLLISGAPAAAVAACDAGGKWAARIALPVSWRANTALKGGRGQLAYAALIERSPLAAPGHFAEAITLCSLEQPPTQTMVLWGGERFAVDYAAEGLAPAGSPPLLTTAFFADIAAEAPGDDDGPASTEGLPDYQTAPTSFEVGVRLPGGAKAPWPVGPQELAPWLLQSGEAHGAVARSRQDDGFVKPPIDYTRRRRADTFYVASRAILSTEANWQGCDRLAGTASLGDIERQPSLSSTLVGCRTEDGGSCSPTDLSLSNLFQPNWRASGAGTFVALRLPTGASCADALEALSGLE